MSRRATPFKGRDGQAQAHVFVTFVYGGMAGPRRSFRGKPEFKRSVPATILPITLRCLLLSRRHLAPMGCVMNA